MAKILAIDDSLTIRKLVDMILRGAGHQVVLSEKGATGLELAKAERPDLILLDYVLPDMQSPEICRQLLEDPATSEIPVLLISTNGAAIRQLYSDSGNVRDYLTKPFQAKVLQTVVEHLLAKKVEVAPEPPVVPPVETVEPAGVPTPQPPLTEVPAPSPIFSAPEPIVPVPPHKTEPPSRIAPAPASRIGAGVASALASDGHAALRALLNMRFRAIAKLIPDLESRRGPLAADTYYLPFLLRNELVSEIVAEVSRTQISADSAMPLIAGTHEWMGIDTTFFHLGRTKATGVFSFKLPGETVEVMLLRGDVVLVSSNNPRVYCTGAAYNFRAAPPAAISTAVAIQQRDSVPFFLTLYRMGALRDPAAIKALLRAQGVRALHRVMTTVGARYAFVPRETLPEVARMFPLEIEVRQFMLEVLRRIDDWLEIESTTGSVESVFARESAGHTIAAQLSLSPEETAVLGVIDGQRTLQQIAEAAQVDLFTACAVVYRMLKLNVLRVVPVTAVAVPFSDPAVEEFLKDTASSDWDGYPAPSANPFPPRS